MIWVKCSSFHISSRYTIGYMYTDLVKGRMIDNKLEHCNEGFCLCHRWGIFILEQLEHFGSEGNLHNV